MFYIQLMVLQLQIAAAVLLVLLVRLIIRKLPKVYSYLLWLLVFARLLCPVVPESAFGIMPSQTEGTAWVEQVWTEQALPDKNGGAEAGNFQPAEISPGQSPQIAGGNGAVQNPGGGHPSVVPSHMSDVEAQYRSQGRNSSTGYANSNLMMAGIVFLAVWGLGAAVILGYNGFALLRVRKELKSAAWFSENVYVCDGISAPFTLGMIRPKIYIPQGLLDKERDYIICHERVHISRKDYLVKNLAFLLTALYWFNPFVWVAFLFLERDMEMSCDERVIRLMGTEIKRQYSQSLLNFAEGKGSMAVTPLTFGENSVKQRVKNVLSYENAKRWSIILGLLILAAASVALFTTRAGRADAAPQEEHEDAAPQEESSVADAEGQADRGLMDGELIESREAFEQRYGKAGAYDFGYDNTGYAMDAYQVILRHLTLGTETSVYERYTDPVTAAEEILHLGAGEGQADYAMVPLTVEGLEIPWLEALSMAGEGSRATVTYTFAGDGSTVEIPMELIEGSAGIWGPADCGMSRTVYRTREANSSAQGEEAFYIQTSQYGIYCLDSSGLRCVYPYYVPDVVWAEADGKLYFPASTSYQDGDLDYWEDVICILDLETGAFDKETYPITDEMRGVMSPLRWMSVYGGFLQLHGEDGNSSLYLPLINTGTTDLSSGNNWKGKAMAVLTEEERNAYGRDARNYLLEYPGRLVELSNRTFSENYIYVDLDGDGRTEQVSLSANPNEEGYTEYPYDAYVLRSGDSVLEGWYECMHNSIWAVSLDGKEIVLVLYGDGPSGDPMTFLYRYEQGTLREAGSFADDIRRCTIEDGVINGSQRQDVVQTDWVKAQWRMGTNERQEKVLEWVPHDTYDFMGLRDITLTTRLTVHTAPDMASAASVIQPQTVRFVKTDASFTWVCLETENGDTGWFATEESGLQIPEAEGKSEAWEVFENLSFAG